MRRLVPSALLLLALCRAAPAAGADIVDCFVLYYRQEITGRTYNGPLDFLREAAAANKSPREVLEAGASRAVVIDRRVGYLRIDDSLGTDQVLTMALYRKVDGGKLLLVVASNCADGCSFSAQVFSTSRDGLRSLPFGASVPRVAPAEFIKPGHRMPNALAGLTPSIDYVPDRASTVATLKPWYGYEVEAQMDGATRAAIRDVVLSWDPLRGRFVKSAGGR